VPILGGIYTAWAGTGTTSLILRALVASICLLPPTLLMGGTLPVVARGVEATPNGVSWLGFFYGGNLVGAVAGSLLAGFYLLRTYDMPTATFAAAQGHTSSKFSGAKVNAGTVTHSVKDGKNILTLSSDFQVPDTPDPHWQIVDSKGNTYLLQRLGVKSLGGLAKDRINTSITLPAYVKDVAKVQIYCAWAEAVLGEASFGAPLATMTMDK